MLPGTDRDTCLIFPLVSTTIWVLMVSAFFFPEYPEPVSLRSVLCSVASTTNFRISSSLKSVFSVGISKKCGCEKKEKKEKEGGGGFLGLGGGERVATRFFES